MEIKVIVEAAPELMTAIDTLTAALVELIGKREKTKPANSAKPADKPADKTKPVGQPAYTLETVRAKLAALSQSGKQKEVKAIIESFGVKKLTDIPAEKYPEVMKRAADLVTPEPEEEEDPPF
jgi:hypothetical protein